uniref:Zinc finger protein 385C n=1 Tax=Salarias fasciatus TaxID=181472 RepID=A0A672FZ25_SALFA
LRVTVDPPFHLFMRIVGGAPGERSAGGAALSALHRPKRERKQRSYTLCDVCNIQLNSAAQAQIHYNGKSHQKRLKQLSSGKTPGFPPAFCSPSGSSTSAQGSPLLASLPVPGRPLQPQLDLKHLLPFRLNGSSPLSLFPNFNTVRRPLAHSQTDDGLFPRISTRFSRRSPQNQAEAHYKGHKHARKLKAMEAQKNRQRRVSSVELAALSPPQVSPSSQLSETASDAGAPEAPEAAEAPGSAGGEPAAAESAGRADAFGEPCGDDDKDPKKSKAHLHCPVCKVTVNSVSQLEAHNSGTKHKLMLEGHSVLPRRRGKVVAARAGCKSKRLASKGSVGLPSKSFQCEVCEIFVNSETQLSQHMNSRRHKDRLAGKPPKPKFTPHSKSQPSAGLATKLALQKQLTKSLTTGFLPGPLSPPTLCTVAANPLALRHPVGTAAFIQTPFLSPALFRPAPGPLRATHTPIIFSPY